MRRIVVMASVSIDGFFAGPDGGLEWQLIDEELHRHFNDELRAMSAFLDGRLSWELMASYWPTADDDPDAGAAEVEFADIWRRMPKYVYSRTLEEAGWGTTVVRDVVPDDVIELKSRPGGDMALGGANLLETFRRYDLVDEYRLYVHPVLIGTGRPLFGSAEARQRFDLAETRTFGSGVQLLRYSR